MAFLLAHYGRKQLAAFSKALERARVRSTEKRIHALRVAMKQLRTLLRLAEGIDAVTQPPTAAVGRLLTLFKAAGGVREAQVSTGLVVDHEKLDPVQAMVYLEHLKKRSSKAAKVLDQALDEMHARDARKLGKYFASVSADHTHTQERRSARLYVDREMRMAMTLVRAGARGEALHEVRKHLKNAWHTLRLLKDVDTLTERQTTLFQRLGSIQESLGDWHDLQVVYDDLAGLSKQDTVAVLKQAIGSKLKGHRAKLMRELRTVLTV